MAKKDTSDQNTSGLTRRDFLKVAGVAGAAGGVASVVDWVAVAPNPALAATVVNNYDKITTCPYCSVGCNMRVGLDADGNVVDVIGDPDCPINNGKLCSKGAAAIQLVNNERRVGVPNSIHTASRTYGPMMRTGNGAWTAVTWDAALTDIAARMVAARSDKANWISGGKVVDQAQGVAFLGCSHATNEENWLYRKMIANFGTNNIEHQARI
jgi:formate dehydrogenase major subunit